MHKAEARAPSGLLPPPVATRSRSAPVSGNALIRSSPGISSGKLANLPYGKYRFEIEGSSAKSPTPKESGKRRLACDFAPLLSGTPISTRMWALPYKHILLLLLNILLTAAA